MEGFEFQAKVEKPIVESSLKSLMNMLQMQTHFEYAPNARIKGQPDLNQCRTVILTQEKDRIDSLHEI